LYPPIKSKPIKKKKKMKKLFLSFILLLSVTAMMAQGVQRTMVAVEDGTGTWCQYCPGAAMGCDDLLSHGCLVAVIANHNGDSYANTYSNARNTMWNISGFPSVCFDGTTGVVGGNHTSSMYSSYLPKYNAEIIVPSPCQMSWVITNSGLNYTAVITLTKVANITSTNNVLYFFVTQSHIQQAWQGQTHLEHVNRLMSPDENGTPIDFSTGDVQVVTLNFTMDAAWPLADCEFIAMLQDKDPGQGNIPGGGSSPIKKWVVYNSVKRATIDLHVDFTASATTIPVNGSVTFTNGTTGGYIGTPETYQWSFPGGSPDTSTQQNPVISYPNCGAHDVQLIVNRGGQIDTLTKTAYIAVGTVVNVNAIPNDTVCDNVVVTLDATTPGATYLWAPGGATTPTIQVDPAVWGTGNHIFSVTVSTPDGCVQTLYPNVFFKTCTGLGNMTNEVTTKIYPNPNSGTFTLEMNSLIAENVNISVTNSLGVNVYTETGITFSGKYAKQIKMNNVPAGVYFLTVKSSDKTSVQKFLVK
jgi:PKD repeat protein